MTLSRLERYLSKGLGQLFLIDGRKEKHVGKRGWAGMSKSLVRGLLDAAHTWEEFEDEE